MQVFCLSVIYSISVTLFSSQIILRKRDWHSEWQRKLLEELEEIWKRVSMTVNLIIVHLYVLWQALKNGISKLSGRDLQLNYVIKLIDKIFEADRVIEKSE